jgi:phospholipid/cholesterol/gamma-HCH transport system ATP-binding protein
MDELIRVDKLVVRFGDHTVLHGVDLVLHPNEILVVLGSSGCGKSTLLRHIVGLRAPEGGNVTLFGTDLYAIDEEQRGKLLTRVGMLFQSGALFNSLSLEENVALPLIEHRGIAPEIAEVLGRMKLSLVGLDNAARLLPAEISGGMKKRAGLARALALDPEILLFDEPSAGLDPITARGLDDLILDLKSKLGVGIVVVTHELASIGAIADRVMMLDAGRVIAQGTLAEVRAMDHPQVHAFFGREARRDGGDGTRPIAELMRLAES